MLARVVSWLRLLPWAFRAFVNSVSASIRMISLPTAQSVRYLVRLTPARFRLAVDALRVRLGHVKRQRNGFRSVGFSIQADPPSLTFCKVGAGLPPAKRCRRAFAAACGGREQPRRCLRLRRIFPLPRSGWRRPVSPSSPAFPGGFGANGGPPTGDGEQVPSGGKARQRGRGGLHRVDGDALCGSGIIDTIGPPQADEPLSVALAKGHGNTAAP